MTVKTSLYDTGKQSILNSFQNVLVLYNFQVLSFTLKQFIWILARLEHPSASPWIHLRHLLRHLVRSCELSANGPKNENVGSSPLSLPRMNIKTDCSPKRLRKYQDKLETHRTSKSRVATPDCNIDLNRMVRGNGSFTDWRTLYQPSGHIGPSIEGSIGRTDYKAGKEGIDPAHD